MIIFAFSAYALYFLNVFAAIYFAFKNHNKVEVHTPLAKAIGILASFYMITFAGFLDRIGFLQIFFLSLMGLNILLIIFSDFKPQKSKAQASLIGLFLQFLIFYYGGFFDKLPLVLNSL